MKQIHCITKEYSQTNKILNELHSSGINVADISVLYPNATGIEHQNATKVPEGAAAGSVAGGVTGGVLGLLVGLGSLAIPGVGPFIAAGPIMAALSGAALGAATGGLAGSLIGLGIPEYEAKEIELQLKQGGTLIAVSVLHDEQAAAVRKIFEQAGATGISTATLKDKR